MKLIYKGQDRSLVTPNCGGDSVCSGCAVNCVCEEMNCFINSNCQDPL